MIHGRFVSIFLVLYALCPGVFAAGAQTCETRGTWLTSDLFDSEAARSETLDKLDKARFNTVFVAVPPVEDNYGQGTPEDFGAIVREAWSRGLSVHAWVNNMHRKGRLPDSESLDFTEEEREAQVRWMQSVMARYGVFLDGFHLDYIRYTSEDPAFEIEERRMKNVTETVKNIHRALKTAYPDKYLTAAVWGVEPAWQKDCVPDKPSPWSEGDGNVPEWFRDWYDDNPGDLNVYDGAEARKDDETIRFVGVPVHMKVQQNPVEWLSSYESGESIIDGILPMQYTLNDSVWQRDLDLWTSFVNYAGGDASRIFMGLGWVWDDVADWGFDAPGIARKIEYGRARGAAGFSVFRLGDQKDRDGQIVDDDVLVDALSSGPFRERVPSCLKAPSATPVCVEPVESRVNISFLAGQGVRLELKSASSEKIWVLLEVPELAEGLLFARASDSHCQANDGYLFPFSDRGALSAGAEELYYDELHDGAPLDFGLLDPSGFKTINVWVMKGDDPRDLEPVQTVVLRKAETP